MGCGSSKATETSQNKVSDTNTGNRHAKASIKHNNTVGNGKTKTTTQAKNATESLQQDPKLTKSTEKVKTSNDGKGISNNLNIKPKTEALRFNYDDFQAIDNYAKQTPEVVTTDVETLAEYLIKLAKNDVEKVRAFYVWICENISYDTDSFFGGTSSSLDHSGNGTLKSRRSVCEGYSRLVEALCKAVGIECIKITGYAKGYGHRPDDVISFDQKTNHAWNAVKVGGKWRFIESTWGAGHVDKNRKYVKQFSNFYFLSPAEDFICDHFPYMNNNLEESNQWQLLKTPITIETYSQLLKPSKEARLYGIKFTSHPFTTIQVVKSTTIKINAPKNKFQDFFFDIYDSDGNVCNEAVIALLKTNTEAIITVRPPKVMRYKLELHTKMCDAFIHITDYIINCTAKDDDYEPYPTHRGYYGPLSDFEKRGFALTGVNPMMHCQNGNFKFQLTTTSQPQVLLHLYDSEGIEHQQYAIIEESNKSINICARLVKKGYYKLTLFSKRGEKDEKYTVAYNFLIKNEKDADDDYGPYPLHRGHYGPSSDYIERGFVLTGIVRFMHCKHGELKLQFATTSHPDVSIHLHDSEGTDHKEYTMIEQDNHSISILVRLVKKGYYKLTLFSKKDEKYTVAYNLLIINENEAEIKSPFPGTYSSTQRLHCKLVQPLVRDIPSNSDVVIEFTSPSIEAIMVNKKVYTEKIGDRWKVTTSTGDSGDLTVAGKISGESSYKHVYVFTIKS